jgi:hypothetical protein
MFIILRLFEIHRRCNLIHRCDPAGLLLVVGLDFSLTRGTSLVPGRCDIAAGTRAPAVPHQIEIERSRPRTATDCIPAWPADLASTLLPCREIGRDCN